MKKIILILLLFLSTEIFAHGGTIIAAFGGARGGGFSGGRSFSSSRSSFSSSRSSFGGSRSSGSPATITRPSYSRPSTSTFYSRPSQPSTVHETHVIHHNSGSSFLTNWLMFDALTRPRVQPVAVVGGGMIEGQPMQPVVSYDMHSPIYYFFVILFWVFVIGVFVRFIFCWANDERFFGGQK